MQKIVSWGLLGWASVLAYAGLNVKVGLYVELKEQSAYSKDRARLPVLRETLKMKRNSDESDDS